jgi:hypothetical protein
MSAVKRDAAVTAALYDEDKLEKVFDDCMADQQMSVFGFRWFLGGTAAGAVFTALAPTTLSKRVRTMPFYVLGALGIIGDHYSMKAYCDDCVDVLRRNVDLLPPADVLDAGDDDMKQD